MSNQEYKPAEPGMISPFLNFLDNNVLFRKPVSCLAAIISLLIPVSVLIMFVQFGIFKSNDVGLVFACIFILAVLIFAGFFGALIWWYRRIVRDEGPDWYKNIRRFIQTAGEWLGTFTAISVFGIVIVLMIFMSENYEAITGLIPFPVPSLNIAAAIAGPIGGFLIIIATKIFLFLLDLFVWVIKQIWIFIKWIVTYCVRLVGNLTKTVERNSSIWVGVTWILAAAVVIAALVLCFRFGGIAPVIALAAALAFMGCLLFWRKHCDEKR